MKDSKLKKLEKKLEKTNSKLNKLHKEKELLETETVERICYLSYFQSQNKPAKTLEPAGKHKDKCPTCGQQLEIKKFTAHHNSYDTYGLHYSCPRCPYEYFNYQTAESW